MKARYGKNKFLMILPLECGHMKSINALTDCCSNIPMLEVLARLLTSLISYKFNDSYFNGDERL